MTRYLLDTDALIGFSKQFESAYSLIPRLFRDGDELGVCPINVTEFYAGVDPQHTGVWGNFFTALQYWLISREAAIQAGRWRYQFARRGIQLPTTDTLVAAVAQERQATVVTGNLRDYPMGVPLYPLK